MLQDASREKKLKYTERLQELFTEIDINGDGDLTWEVCNFIFQLILGIY